MLPARLPRDAVKRTYSWIAPFHDILAVLVERKARALALDFGAVHSGEDVLEVAVGTGLSFVKLVQQNPGGTTTGVDITPAMLRRVRRRLRGRTGDVTIREGDAYALPFHASRFDVLLDSYMLDMIPEADFPVILREYHRVLRPGGRLVLCNMAVPRSLPQAMWDAIYRIHPPLLGGCRGISIEPVLAECGFEVHRQAFVSQLTFPSEVLLASRTDRIIDL